MLSLKSPNILLGVSAEYWEYQVHKTRGGISSSKLKPKIRNRGRELELIWRSPPFQHFLWSTGLWKAHPLVFSVYCRRICAQVLHLGYFFLLQNRSAIVYFMFCCTTLGLGDPVIILIWQKQGLLPKELIILLFPQPWQHFHVTSLVPGLTDWDGSGKAAHLSCHYFVSFQSSLFPHPFYCVATWASTWIQGRKYENGKGRHVAPHAHISKSWPGHQPSPTDTLQAMLLLNCALTHQIKMVRWGTFVQASSSSSWSSLNLSDYFIKL